MSSWNTITWDTARAGGLVSYVLLTAAVALGLVLRNRWQSSRWPRLVTNELHGYVSLLALVFIVVHVVAVAVDPFTHFGLRAVLVPFATHYRPLWMSLGIVALYLLLAVWVSSRLRQRIGHRLWRRIHVLAFAVYAAATLHGLGTGSDTRTVWAAALYLGSVGLVGTLLAVRLLAPSGKASRPRPLAAAAAGASVLAAAAWSLTGPFAPGWSARAGGTTAPAARSAAASPRPRLVRASAPSLPPAVVQRALHGPVRRPADRGTGERPRTSHRAHRRRPERRDAGPPRDPDPRHPAAGRRRRHGAEPRPNGHRDAALPRRDHGARRDTPRRRAALSQPAAPAGPDPPNRPGRPGRRLGARNGSTTAAPARVEEDGTA